MTFTAALRFADSGQQKQKRASANMRAEMAGDAANSSL
jgi:hypothetical protein